MESTQPEFANTHVIEGGLSIHFPDQDITDRESPEQALVEHEEDALVSQDPVTIQEARKIECRRRKGELALAICMGTATLEQKAEYQLACSEVHDAQVAYGVEFLGSVVCKKNQVAVA